MSSFIKLSEDSDLASIIVFDHVAAMEDQRVNEIMQAIKEKSCWLYMKDSSVAGYAILNFHFFGQAFIPLVYVAPDFRRNGIAEALILHVLKICQREKLFTSTNQSNANMHNLLKKMGFEKAGQVEGIDDGDPEIFYIKKV